MVSRKNALEVRFFCWVWVYFLPIHSLTRLCSNMQQCIIFAVDKRENPPNQRCPLHFLVLMVALDIKCTQKGRSNGWYHWPTMVIIIFCQWCQPPILYFTWVQYINSSLTTTKRKERKKTLSVYFIDVEAEVFSIKKIFQSFLLSFFLLSFPSFLCWTSTGWSRYVILSAEGPSILPIFLGMLGGL